MAILLLVLRRTRTNTVYALLVSTALNVASLSVDVLSRILLDWMVDE